MMAQEQLQKLPNEVVVQISDVSTWARKTHIQTQASYEKACDALKTLQVMRRTITKHYKKIKDPLNALRKTYLDLEKDDLASVEPAEQRLKSLIVSYEDKKRAEEAVESKRYLDAVDAGDTALPVPVSKIEAPKGHSRRDISRAVVTNLRLLVDAVARNELPIDVLQANIPALNRLLAKQGDLFSAPGVSVETTSVVVGR